MDDYKHTPRHLVLLKNPESNHLQKLTHAVIFVHTLLKYKLVKLSNFMLAYGNRISQKEGFMMVLKICSFFTYISAILSHL